MVRTYMALALGRTGKQEYGSILLDGMNDKDQGSRLAAIKALGLLRYVPAIKGIQKFTAEKYSSSERLAAAIALGNIGDKSNISILQKLLDHKSKVSVFKEFSFEIKLLIIL